MNPAPGTPVVDERNHLRETNNPFRPIEVVGLEYEISQPSKLNAQLEWNMHVEALEPNFVAQITPADLLDSPVLGGTIIR